MKKIKLNLILLLAAVFGLASAFGVYQYLESVKDAYVEKGDYVSVAVAVQRIPAKTQVTPQMFAMREIPSRYVNSDAVVDPKEAAGRLTKADIFPEEQLLKSKIAVPDEPTNELAFMIPEGSRAVTVAVNEVSGVAGMIKPGDHVDLLVTFETDQGVTLTSLLLQNIRVLATDQTTGTAVQPNNQGGKTYQTVTLSATPQQAQQLVFASEQGSIKLTLRSPADKGVTNLPSTKVGDLVR